MIFVRVIADCYFENLRTFCRPAPPPYGFSFRTMYAVGRRNSLHVHTTRGHKRAAMVIEASTAATGRLKNGRMLPSDLMSEVTKLCSTIVPMTMPSTIAATG